jgi:hypothetical protein
MVSIHGAITEINANDLYEVTQMAVSCKKLWQLLIDRDMMKKICKNSRALGVFEN